MPAESEILRFFRPLMNNFHTKLFIPAPVAEHINKAKSRDKVTLVNHKCKMWHVDIHRENKEMYFGGQSWQNFVQDNDLEIGHLLFFKYKGNMVFSFRIYDLTTCEITSRKKRILKDHADIDQSSHSTPEQEVGCSRKRRGGADQNTSKATRYCTRNTYFEARIKAYNLRNGYLIVPTEFRKSTGLTGKFTGISVEDPSGRTWRLGLTHGNARITKGGSEFLVGNLIRSNELRLGDKVIFEFVSAQGVDMHLKMHKL